jgi:hypothetical protein
MPTNKKRKTRKMKSVISLELRAYFENGTWPGNETEADGEVFLLLCNDKKGREMWELCREEIMLDWKRQKRQGLPWAERYFNEGDNNADK